MNRTQPYEATGRTAQKARTRKALIQAAQALIADGITPTVEEAAAAASIARTTAYRYFPNQRDLLVAAYPEMELVSLLGTNPPQDVQARLEAVVVEYQQSLIENEMAQRAALRLSLDPDPTNRDQLLVRQGRAVTWLNDALAPLRGQLPDAAVDRLVLAVRAVIGVEALVWLCDVARLSREDALELMRWSARALLSAALAEANENCTEPGTEQGQQNLANEASL